MPTSVLLAVLAAAGLLALAPALTRRYDGTERVAAERAASTARVLSRHRRQRTVPGPRPINPPRFTGLIRGGHFSTAARSHPSTRSHHSVILDSSGRAGSGSRPRSVARGRSGRPLRRRRAPTALHRRRRVLLALILLNLVELGGVVLVGPGFWIGFSVSFVVSLAYLVYLRRRAVVVARRRRARLRHAAWVRAQQAAVRREHDRRAAERAVAARRAVAERDRARRDALRRSTEYLERYTSRTS